jgi:hypothetical protein
MPRVSEFYGITISMYHSDHEPPHVHAAYGEFKAKFGLDPVAMIEGSFPARAERMVQEWAELHRQELFANWRRARRSEALRTIKPLT